MFKLSKPVLILLLATVAVAVYLLASPAPKRPTASKKPSKPIVRITSTPYTQADRDANFPEPVLASRNSFTPLVMRKSGALAAALAASGNIPAEFAGGDPNWACTGTAEVDGVRQALVENKSTNDGVFLKQGDRWRTSVVSQVLEDGVVLIGPGGEAKTIHVKQEPGSGVDETDLSGSFPVQPEMSGIIGGGGPTGGRVSEAPALPSPQTATFETVESDEN
jgi:hypothetical protein